MPDRTELGEFLRSRREQLRPADLGLPDNGRRRTPGLRRQEVATVAGLSVDYLVRLEQGRDRNPSVAVVSALADALRLDADERVHLKILAACAGTPELCPMGGGEVGEIPATVRSVLDGLDPVPAVLAGPWQQVLAHNAAWGQLMGPAGVLDEAAPNFARFTFLDPRARQFFPSWSEVADEQAAVLRDARVRWRADDRMRALLDELLKVPEFAERWRSHDVARRRRGSIVVVHPDLGRLNLAYEVMLLADETDRRIITWFAADDATETAYRRISAATGVSGRAGHLRAISG